MKTRLHTFLFLGASGVALILTVLHMRSRSVPPSAPVEVPVADEPAEAAQMETNSPAPVSDSRTFPTYHWQTGEHACWQFGVSLRQASAPEKIAEGEETRLGGKLHLVVLSSDSRRVRLAAILTHSYYLAGGERVWRVEQFLNSTPAILTLTPSGNLVELAFPRNVAAEDRNLLRLAYGWEFVVRNAPFYQEEEDGPGHGGTHFRATYRRLDDMRIQKRRFLPRSSFAQSATLQNVLTSEFTGTVGRVWVSELAGWEDILTTVNGSVSGMSRVVVSLKPETNAPTLPSSLSTFLSNPDSRLAFSASAPGGPTSGQTDSVLEAVRREALASRWTGVAFEQVRQSIAILAEQPMQDAVKPLRDFKDWLDAHPEEGPGLVLQSLQGVGTNQWNLSGLLIKGLAESESMPGRQALVSILNYAGSFPPTVAIQAAEAAGDLGSMAGPAMKETLMRLIDSSVPNDPYRLSETALLAFARLARNDSESQAMLIQRVAPWLQANATPGDTVRALSVLRNGGVNDPDLVATALHLYESADENIRSAAEEYLGSLRTSGSDDDDQSGSAG